MCGAGDADHVRHGLYSFLLLDVSTYWMLVRLLYVFPCFAPIRNDLYVVFGFWHPYSYGNVAVWSCFQDTFIGTAFFHLFPSQKLLRRPKLIKMSTFFTWLRLCYTSFRQFLIDTLSHLRLLSLQFDINMVKDCEAGVSLAPSNPYRSRLIHLYNMFFLFDFAIPVLHDYIALLKHNNWFAFRASSLKLLLLFSVLRNKGADTYRAPMFFFHLMTMVWSSDSHVIMDLFRQNHTIWSEEAGEIALSRLANSQPSNTRSSIKDTRQQWQAIGRKSSDSTALPPKSKFRFIGRFLIVFFLI